MKDAQRLWVMGRFCRRLNRFSAEVIIDDHEAIPNGPEAISLVHVANTARLKELLLPGARVRLTRESGEKRKTAYTLRQVEKGQVWVSIDSGRPNQLIRQWLETGLWLPKGIEGPQVVKSEVTWGHSRFDLMLAASQMMIEVKGVSLIKDDWAMFPDAPTERGAKHLRELAEYVGQGGRAAVVFLCQRQDAQRFKPYRENDPDFAAALVSAHQQGVEIYVLRCDLLDGDEAYSGELPWDLGE